jgi:hypothetical protein
MAPGSDIDSVTIPEFGFAIMIMLLIIVALGFVLCGAKFGRLIWAVVLAWFHGVRGFEIRMSYEVDNVITSLSVRLGRGVSQEDAESGSFELRSVVAGESIGIANRPLGGVSTAHPVGGSLAQCLTDASVTHVHGPGIAAISEQFHDCL